MWPHISASHHCAGIQATSARPPTCGSAKVPGTGILMSTQDDRDQICSHRAGRQTAPPWPCTPISPSAQGERVVIVMTASVAAYERTNRADCLPTRPPRPAALPYPAHGQRELASSGIRVMTVGRDCLRTPMNEGPSSGAQTASRSTDPLSTPRLSASSISSAALIVQILET